MTRLDTAGGRLVGDFYLAVAAGKVPGHSLVHKFGRNDAVASATWEHVSLLSGATAFLAAATTVRVKAGNGADTAAGAGAREITIQGIAADLTETSEALATAGASASAVTASTYWRVHRAWVSSAGAYSKANTAAVVIENGGGGTDLIQIAVEEGQTQYAGWTVPTGKTAYMLSADITTDGVKAADVKLMARKTFNDTSAPVEACRLKRYWDGVLGVAPYRPVAPSNKFEALTDIWFEARGSGAGTEVSVDFELLVIDD